MQKYSLIWWIIVAVFLMAPLHPASADSGAIEQGRDLVVQNCSSCHAIGKTDSNAHPDAVAFRDLSKQYPVEQLEEALAEGILSGHPDMPVREFEAEQVGQIIAYLKSIQIE